MGSNHTRCLFGSNPDYFVAAIAAASSLKRNRQTRLAPSPIGWPGSFLARAKSRTRRRVSDKNFAASSASTNASGFSGFIAVPRRFNTTERQRTVIIGDRLRRSACVEMWLEGKAEAAGLLKSTLVSLWIGAGSNRASFWDRIGEWIATF